MGERQTLVPHPPLFVSESGSKTSRRRAPGADDDGYKCMNFVINRDISSVVLILLGLGDGDGDDDDFSVSRNLIYFNEINTVFVKLINVPTRSNDMRPTSPRVIRPRSLSLATERTI